MDALTLEASRAFGQKPVNNFIDIIWYIWFDTIPPGALIRFPVCLALLSVLVQSTIFPDKCEKLSIQWFRAVKEKFLFLWKPIAVFYRGSERLKSSFKWFVGGEFNINTFYILDAIEGISNTDIYDSMWKILSLF